MSTAFVTGGTGFVGSHLIEALLAQGHHVRALVRSPAKAEGLGLAGVEWVRGDLTDLAALRIGVAGADVVYHVAGIVTAHHLDEYMAVNRDGTARVVEAARPVGARLVLVSSLAAAGPAARDRPLLGDEASRPVSNYGRSKLAAETLVRESSLPWVIIRPPAVYGPRDTEMLRLFKTVGFGFAPVFGTGNQQLSFVYGPDLALAIAAAGSAPATVGETLYPAHPEIVSSVETILAIADACAMRARVIPIPAPIGRLILQVTGAAAKLRGRSTLLTPDKGQEFFQDAWTCSPSRLERLTGWRAQHDFRSGARSTAMWYRMAGWL